MTTILTAEQIEEVCDYIPQTYPQTKIFDNVMNNIKNNIRIQLRGKRLSTHPQALQDLKDAIYRQLILSRVKNESFKGIQAAHVLGNISSQTMLHSKRGQGGQNQYVSTFDTIKEYVTFKREMRESIVTVTLRNTDETEAEVYRRYIPSLYQTHLSDLVVDYEFIEQDNELGLRLHLDKNMMYERKTSAGTIIDRLEIIDTDRYLIIPLVSSFDGFLDIFVKTSDGQFLKHKAFEESDTAALSTSEAVILFLTTVIINNMDKIHMGGIRGCQYVSLTKEDIGNLMLREEWLPQIDSWMIYWDQITARNKGILFEHIEDLFDVFGIRPYTLSSVPSRFFISGWPYHMSPLGLIKSIQLGEHLGNSTRDGDTMIVTYDNDKVTIDELTAMLNGMYPGIELDFELNVGSNEPVNQFRISNLLDGENPPEFIRDLSDRLGRMIQITGLEIHTDNIMGVLNYDDIDTRTISSNNPRSVLWFFGIEALRYMTIANMAQLMFDSGKEFNTRHLDVIVDHMTMHGYVTPISSLGVEGHRLGPITESAYSTGDQIFAKAAQFGRRDQMNTISAYISTGQKGRFGTDYARSIGMEISGTESERQILRDYEQQILDSI